MPPLLADFIHARGCKLICAKLLTLPAGNTYIRNPDGAGVDIVWTEESCSLAQGTGRLGDSGAVIVGR